MKKKPAFFWLTLALILGMLFAGWALQRFTHRDFAVRNAGSRPIHVLAVVATPTGFARLWSPNSPEFRDALGPGAQAHFRYDFDAATLCGLVVVVDGEPPRALKNPPDSWKCVPRPESGNPLCCWPIGEELVLVVPPAEALEPLPEAFEALLAPP